VQINLTDGKEIGERVTILIRCDGFKLMGFSGDPCSFFEL